MFSIKRLIWIMVISIPMVLIIGLTICNFFGFTFMGIMVIIFLYLPPMIFVALYGFYKALVKNHALKGNEKLFWGGRF